MTDPFRTGSLRAATLRAWADSPTRFREDANAEEDLLLGGYADRWLVELAQNAADAARRSGEPGRLLVRAVDGELRVANTGAPLDADGVTALASLRASSKRDGESVGRFGVGFAAVLGVTDQPTIVSSPGGVSFSSDRTRDEVRALGGPAADELNRRGGRPPVLRLCWPADHAEPPPDGYRTEVRMPPRAGVRPDELCAGADAAAPDLLLALPWLVEITVHGSDGRTVSHRRSDDGGGGGGVSFGRQTGRPTRPAGSAEVTLEPGGRRWLLARREGRYAEPAAAAEDPLAWSVCWALPVDADGRPLPLGEDVLHAPTPSDERLSLPARLLASLPMQPSRRRVRTGPATDAVIAEAARAYLDLARAVSPAHRLGLAPEPGFPLSELDAALRDAVGAELRGQPWLPTAPPVSDLCGYSHTNHSRGVRPADAILVEPPALAEALAEVVPGILAPGDGSGFSTVPRAALTALGVPTLALAELADRLAGLRRPPSWWRELYAALATEVDRVPSARDELAALPVPLVDGRTVTGPRTVTALTGGSAALTGDRPLDLPGLRILHPEAAHPLLIRLGVTEAGPAELLDHPSIRDAVTTSVAAAEEGDRDPEPLADLVLALVAELAGDVLATRPWLAALALPDEHGEPARADELMLPDAAIAPLLVPDAPIGVLDGELVARHPRRVLTSVGVLDSFALLADDEPAGPEHDLDDEDRWWDGFAATGRPEPERVVAVRDLDLVADDAWPAALAELARLAGADPVARAALHDPDGYTAWWLAEHARLGGHRPAHWRLPGATALAGLYDPVPLTETAPEKLLTAIGVRTDVSVRTGTDAEDLLRRLADPARTPESALVWAAHAELADAVVAGRCEPDDLDPPDRLRALAGTVTDAGPAVLLDRPWLAPALDPAHAVPGPFHPEAARALADLLDLPLASEVVRGEVTNDQPGNVVSWSALPEVVAACAALGVPVPAGELVRHEKLIVELTRPARGRVEVPVWRQDGRWHVADLLRGLAAAANSSISPG
ncbi:molecular chaperone Hsp90 [Pseudonocardia eucalypti]|uniref:Molecular chaperone Hsp90 n=1 Tax=Pseudonocardia eucalypti TaxID=648755 RepID=A0ABP9QF11_9PSEU|nr:hypothetical protein [Pseudonocardia eucalypti]